jgi:adenylate kinase
MNVVLLGAPGSGKGTQAERMVARYRLMHVSTGDLFRHHLAEGTPLGTIAEGHMREGSLVPDAVTVAMIRERIEDSADAGGLLLDGFPRTVAQAEALGALLAERGERVDAAILLDVPEDMLLQRLLGRGRADDVRETIATRLAAYRDQTLPVVAHYQGESVLRRVDGVGEVDAIAGRIAAALDGLAAA